jgi:hypothetical protein
LLRGLPLNRSTLRQEFEQLLQAWPWSGLARFGPPTPTRAEKLSDASIDHTDALSSVVSRDTTIHLSFAARVAAGVELDTLLNL